MSVSRVRENRTHGSMRRREATPDQSATAARPRNASRRPYNSAVSDLALSNTLKGRSRLANATRHDAPDPFAFPPRRCGLTRMWLPIEGTSVTYCVRIDCPEPTSRWRS